MITVDPVCTPDFVSNCRGSKYWNRNFQSVCVTGASWKAHFSNFSDTEVDATAADRATLEFHSVCATDAGKSNKPNAVRLLDRGRQLAISAPTNARITIYSQVPGTVRERRVTPRARGSRICMFCRKTGSTIFAHRTVFSR